MIPDQVIIPMPPVHEDDGENWADIAMDAWVTTASEAGIVGVAHYETQVYDGKVAGYFQTDDDRYVIEVVQDQGWVVRAQSISGRWRR